MIIFFTNEGEIRGKIFGRIHDEKEIAMEQSENGKKLNKLVLQWKPYILWDREGNMVLEDSVDEKGNKLAFTADFEPEYHPMYKVEMDRADQNLWFSIDRDHHILDNYKVHLKTLKLVPK